MFDVTVVFWPSTRTNLPFQGDTPEGSDTFQWQLWEEIALACLANEMGQGKKSHGTLMHRKRVTSELHDSYFRLMTTKHAIAKIEWAIEWALNYYLTLSRQRSVGVRDEMW